MVFALAGDSTITKFFCISIFCWLEIGCKLTQIINVRSISITKKRFFLYIIYIVMRFYLPSRDKIKKLFKNMEEIKRLISENKLEEAIRLLDAYLTEQPRSDEAWFLLGKAHYKLGNVRLALNSYLQAIEINPESPAQAAYDMAIKVLDFYNKDMYNH